MVAALALVTAACDSSDADLSTTSSLLGGVSDGSGSGGSEDGATTTTLSDDVGGGDGPTTTLRGSSVGDSWEVIAREPAEGGEILYIVIPQADYTDVDIENFVGDLVESETVTWGVEIFDDVDAVDAYRLEETERTEEQVELLSRHHFASVTNGDTLVFRGPFEASGSMAIGS